MSGPEANLLRTQTMSAPPFDLVLELLRGIRADVGHIRGDLIEIKERLGLLEGGYASLSRRVDRIGGDVERINVCVELSDAPAP
jgi:hypothetical protein